MNTNDPLSSHSSRSEQNSESTDDRKFSKKRIPSEDGLVEGGKLPKNVKPEFGDGIFDDIHELSDKDFEIQEDRLNTIASGKSKTEDESDFRDIPETKEIINEYTSRDKIAEDYETRVKYRSGSIWNRSEHDSYGSRPAQKREYDQSQEPGTGGKRYYRNTGRHSEYSDRNNGNRSYDRDSDNPGNEYRHGRGNDYRNDHYNNSNREENRSERSNSPNEYRRDYRNWERYNNRDNREQGEFSRHYPRTGRYDNLEPETGARGRHGEPISLAEELALERSYSHDVNHEGDVTDGADKSRVTEPEDETLIASLQKMSMQELVIEARKQNLNEVDGEIRQDLIFRILKERIKKNGLMFGEGTLEILPDEFGFLRSTDYNYISCPDDIYISPSQIRRFGLRNGLTVSGQIRPPKERERYFALLRIEAINQEDPNELAQKPLFDDLTAVHPDERIVLETPDGDINTRVVDLTVPVGFGQRGLIVSPPRAGKTILMQKMARAVLTNYPESYVFMLLVDERPEEVTDMERQIKGPHCEVVSSTFDESPSRHIQVSEMVLEKAKRMVEYGKNVVIFLDSITRLARAWNTECPMSGKTLTGGIDANALQRPKKFFGSARKVEEKGSLTIIATALIDTGNRMDEVIFEEFKGTGNLEIWLDRSLVDKRIWPAIDITKSGTRREEMILDPEEYRRISLLRRVLADMNPVDAMDYLTQKLARTKNNAEFLMGLKIN